MKSAIKSSKASATTMAHFLFACIIFLCAATAGLAQAGRGSISGQVSDPTGAIVPGARVTALNHATGIALHSVTTSAGLYSFVSLNPGVYEVTASLKGFESVAQDNVSVTVDQVSTVNITLRVGSVSEVVTVTESTSLVEASNSTVGQLISSQTIDRVPLLSRNVFDLVQLSAGVTPANGAPNSSSSYAITNISSGRPGVDVSSYTINGAIVGSVYYMLDGSPLGVAEQNVAAVIPAMEIPEDGVEETRVETQNTPANYLSGGAGVISLASKSGGDKFHGDGFVVMRPNVLAANEWFNKQAGNPTPAYHRYQEGGAIGGPILHKKLFFFGDYEATQQQAFDGSSQFTVPTTAERTGNFSADSFAIYDPTLPDNPDGTRQQVTGNKIANPNPIAVKFLSEFPKCNYPVASTCDQATNGGVGQYNLYVPGLDPTTQQKFDVRMDYYAGEKQRLFGRFSFDRLFTSGVNAFNNPWDLDYAQNITNGRNFIIGDDYTINPSTVLQLRYSFTRHYENQGGDPGQAAIDNLATLGFTTPTAADEVYKTLPYVNFDDVGGGIGGTANYNTFIYASQNHDVIATLTKSWGKHEISAGAEYMKRFLNDGQPPAPSGAYAFDISATDQSTANGGGGSDFASFLFGMGEQAGVTHSEGNDAPNFTKDLFVAESNPYYAAFVEDTYHLSHALTITAGVRWDIFGGKTERHNRLEYFDPTATFTAGAGTYTGGEVFAKSGSRTPFTTNMHDIGPRLGISWQPERHMVVRGGGGFYYGPSAHMVGSPNLDSDGFSSQTTWAATCLNADGNTVYNGTNTCWTPASTTGGIITPGYLTYPTGPAPSATGIYSLTNPFPTVAGVPGIIQLTGATQGLATNLGSPLSTMLHSQPTQRVYNFNFGVEYEFPHEIVLSVGYVGSRGLYLPFAAVDLNQLPLSTLATMAIAGDSTDDMVAAEPFPQFTNGSISATGANNGVIAHGYPAGDSEYSSLQTKVQKRLTHHFTTLASFTWGKIMTDDGNPPLGFVGSHAGSVQDWRNLNLEHSVSPQDVKYQFTAQASYDLPVGKGRAVNLHGVANAILGDWTTDAIFYLSTGVPINSPAVGSNTPYYFNQRTNMTCDPSKGAPHTAAQWFTPACFSQPTPLPGDPSINSLLPYVAGNAPAYLDHVRTMGADDLDFTLSKSFKLGGERSIRIDLTSYNVANKAQLGAPAVNSEYSLVCDANHPNCATKIDPTLPSVPYSSGSNPFGAITSTVNSPRQFQGGARFTF
jgi:hypothetical protein